MTKDQKLAKIKRGFYLIDKLEAVFEELDLMNEFEQEITTLQQALSIEKENLQ